jgi:hypothetical protein
MAGLRTAVHRAVVAAAVVALAGCGAEPEAEVAVRTDSAGVELVRSVTPRVDSVRPALGETLLSPTSQGHEFYGVADVVLLDSLLIVAEPTQLRAFRMDGSLAWSFGREGDGPREFRRIAALEARGDSVAVLDTRTRRISLVSAAGAWVRGLPLEPSLLITGELVSLSGGTFGVVATSPSLFDGEAPNGLVRTPQTLLAVDWADGSATELVELAGEEGIRQVQGQGVTIFRALFGRRSLPFSAPGGFGVAEGVFRGFEIRDAEGSLRRRVSAAVDLTLGESMVEAEWSAREETLGADAAQGLRDRSPVPALAPGADAALATPSGEVWLREPLGEYRSRVGPGPHVWAVFAPDGSWAARVSTPISFTVHRIDDETVIGVERDELGVEHPQLRRRN